MEEFGVFYNSTMEEYQVWNLLNYPQKWIEKAGHSFVANFTDKEEAAQFARDMKKIREVMES